MKDVIAAAILVASVTFGLAALVQADESDPPRLTPVASSETVPIIAH